MDLLVSLTEVDRVQAALDIAEAVFYLHNLSTPAIHQHIAPRYTSTKLPGTPAHSSQVQYST